MPATAPVTLTAESSTPISPNHVRSDCTPGTGEGGPVFLLRTGDAAVPALPLGSPGPSETASACPPRLGEPVAFDISSPIPGSDTTAMSFLVVPLVTLTGKDRFMHTVLLWIRVIIPW